MAVLHSCIHAIQFRPLLPTGSPLIQFFMRAGTNKIQLVVNTPSPWSKHTHTMSLQRLSQQITYAILSSSPYPTLLRSVHLYIFTKTRSSSQFPVSSHCMWTYMMIRRRYSVLAFRNNAFLNWLIRAGTDEHWWRIMWKHHSTSLTSASTSTIVPEGDVPTCRSTMCGYWWFVSQIAGKTVRCQTT
jgi:hypothetical protein